MRTIACILSPFVLVAAAACNTSSPGDKNQLEFTPTECGNPLLGCDLDLGLVAGGVLDLEVRSLGTASLDGVTLVSATPSVLTVTDIADGDAPTWAVQGVGPGIATLSAIDRAGIELDTLRITVATADRLTLNKLAGNATGPTDAAGVDEAWQVDADGLVSFQAVPMSGAGRLIGRLAYTLTVPPSSAALLDREQSTSDPTKGYLYVQPAAGAYTFTFTAAAEPVLTLNVGLTAQ